MYDRKFFEGRNDAALRSARAVVPHLLKLADVKSAIDLGCGQGVWLAALMEHGITDVEGRDGYAPDDLLLIPQERFVKFDISEPLEVTRRYDLAISLEAGEHIPARKAQNLVTSLTKSADLVLFSAAIPGQGGTGHINEQWQSYWARMFLGLGYQALDLIRPAIWAERAVSFWYRQNILLYANEAAMQRWPALRRDGPLMLDVVHPELYSSKHDSAHAAVVTLKRKVREKLPI